MDKTDKLFLFGIIGVLANFIFFVVFDFIEFYLWEAYLCGNGSYPGFLDSYGGLIAEINFILFFLFLGFNAGVVLSWLAREGDK